jgi:hypothetical protein
MFRTKDGRFEWRGIPPQLWMITASARGYQRFDLDLVEIPPNTTKEVVMPLQRGHALRGRVYDETSSVGIASASVSFREAHLARYDGNFRMRVKASTSKDGSFVLDGVPAGPVILSVSAQNYAGREIDVSVAEQSPPVQIGLSVGGSIAGYLAGADGVTPAAGRVQLYNPGDGENYFTRTYEAGQFSFNHLPPGLYRVVGRSGSRTTQQEVFLAKEERKQGIVLALAGGGRTVRGVVTGLSPADLQSVQVGVFHTEGYRNTASTGVDAQGAYETRGVEPGEVIVRAYLPSGRETSKVLQVPADTDVVANIEFGRGSRLSGSVTRGGKPVAGIPVNPRSAKNQSIWIDGSTSSDRGEYAVEDLADGEYYIVLDSYRTRNFHVNGDTVFDIDVPATDLSGRTVEDGGKAPVVGVDIFIWSTQPESTGMHTYDRSNHFGEFTFKGLESGEYLLSAYKPGYEMYRERISYSAATDGITLQLRPAKGVEVRLREAGSGLPIRNAQVRETIDGRPGSGIRLHLDENGAGYIPRAMAGSTLTFYAGNYAPVVVSEWGGQELDVQFEKRRPR